MTTANIYIYSIALTALTIYCVRLLRSRPLGATAFFLFFVLFFHGPAFIFYVNIWSLDLGLGLLGSQIPYTDDLVSQVAVAMTICVVLILSGCLLGERIFYSAHQRIAKSPSYSAECSAKFRGIRRRLVSSAGVLILFALSILSVQFLFISGPSAIVQYYFNVDLSSLERFTIRREANVNFYPYGVLINSIIPLVGFILVAEALQSRSKGLLLYATFIIGVVLLAKLAQYTKAGPGFLIIQLLFCYSLYRRGSTYFTFRDVLLFSIALVLTFGIVFMVGGMNTDIFVFFDRLLMIPNEGIFEYFNAIPSEYPFGFGRGISWIALFIGDAAGSAENIPTHMHVAAVTRGEYGTVVNSFFIADAWAEFSWAGIIVMSFAAGVLVQWYDARTYRIDHSSIRIGLTVFALTAAYALATSSITTSLITGGMLICPIFAGWLDRSIRTRFVLPGSRGVIVK